MEFKEQIQLTVHLLKFDVSCRCFGQMFTVCSPCEQSHYEHHDRESYTEHNAADGQLDWTMHGSWRSQIWHSGRILEQKDGSEVLKHRPSVFWGDHLAPPSPVAVFSLEFGDQSDVAAWLPPDLIPVWMIFSFLLGENPVKRHRLTHTAAFRLRLANMLLIYKITLQIWI